MIFPIRAERLTLCVGGCAVIALDMEVDDSADFSMAMDAPFAAPCMARMPSTDSDQAQAIHDQQYNYYLQEVRAGTDQSITTLLLLG